MSDKSIDAAWATIPSGWWVTLDRYMVSDDPAPNELTWRVWLKRLVGDLEGDGLVYQQKAFGIGATPADAIEAAVADSKRFYT